MRGRIGLVSEQIHNEGPWRLLPLLVVALVFMSKAAAQEGIDPLNAPDWLPPLRPPNDGEPQPGLPEDVPGLIILPEKEYDPSEVVDPEVVPDADSPEPNIAKWHRNPKKAHKLAKEQGKYHLMALLGIEWPTPKNPSRLIAMEVLNTAHFAEKTRDDFVLSFVDYPPNKNDWSDTHKKLKSYYGVKGFPAVIVFDDQGKQVGVVAGYKSTAEEDDRKLLFSVEFNQLIKSDKEAKEREIAHHKRLVDLGFREWKSKQGSLLFARLERANDKVAVFRDSDNRKRKVLLKQLWIGDRELVKRMVQAKHVAKLR